MLKALFYIQMSLHGTVQSIEGDHAILLFEGGQTLKVPITACEGQMKSGGEVRAIIAAIGAEDAGR